MANIDKLIPHIIKWEGGSKFTNDPLDRGGATKYGITIGTLQGLKYDTNHDGKVSVDDVKSLLLDDFKVILKKQYWDRWKADDIANQSVANLLVDWLWGSGKHGIIIPQRCLGVTPDGKVGQKTINALNGANQKLIYNKVWQARKEFYYNIVSKNPSQSKWLKGWLNRLNDLKFSE
jgi:secretion activator protein, putative